MRHQTFHQAVDHATSWEVALMQPVTLYRSRSPPTGSNSITVHCRRLARHLKDYRAVNSNEVEVACQHHHHCKINTWTVLQYKTRKIHQLRPLLTADQLVQAEQIKRRCHPCLIEDIFDQVNIWRKKEYLRKGENLQLSLKKRNYGKWEGPIDNYQF